MSISTHTHPSKLSVISGGFSDTHKQQVKWSPGSWRLISFFSPCLDPHTYTILCESQRSPPLHPDLCGTATGRMLRGPTGIQASLGWANPWEVLASPPGTKSCRYILFSQGRCSYKSECWVNQGEVNRMTLMYARWNCAHILYDTDKPLVGSRSKKSVKVGIIKIK